MNCFPLNIIDKYYYNCDQKGYIYLFYQLTGKFSLALLNPLRFKK